MRIKEVESIVGITRKNIRFYEKEGLLSPGRESENSYRDYGQEDITRLKQIKLLRKLDLPISEIKDVLEGRISLSVAVKRHYIVLEEQRSNIGKAQKVCEMISGEMASISEIDTDAYLSGMESMEKEGAIFVNIQKNDVMKKYLEPVIACVIIVLLATAIVFGLVWLHTVLSMPAGLFWALVAVFAIVAVGTVAALVSRIKEIRGGEENDLGKY